MLALLLLLLLLLSEPAEAHPCSDAQESLELRQRSLTRHARTGPAAAQSSSGGVGGSQATVLTRLLQNRQRSGSSGCIRRHT